MSTIELKEVYHLTPNKAKESAHSIKKEKTVFLNDHELWAAFSKGNESAFMIIYNDYFNELCDFGVQIAPLSLVEDAIQDLFIDLRKKRSTLPDVQKSIRLFLFQCLKRRLFNVLKKENKMIKGEIGDHSFGVTSCHESVIILNQDHKEKIEKLEKALAGLNKKHREAIYYYFYKGMPYEEVQDLLGFQDVKSARNLIYKVVKRLKSSFLIFF